MTNTTFERFDETCVAEVVFRHCWCGQNLHCFVSRWDWLNLLKQEIWTNSFFSVDLFEGMVYCIPYNIYICIPSSYTCIYIYIHIMILSCMVYGHIYIYTYNVYDILHTSFFIWSPNWSSLRPFIRALPNLKEVTYLEEPGYFFCIWLH